ncbi:MAG: hypothetical protein L3J13_03845, partial [Devosiaceae bacterium]|nr:hypothetical protein [Devosiaceae bacterium]
MIHGFSPLPEVPKTQAFKDWTAVLSIEQVNNLEPAFPVLQPLFCAAPYLMDLAQKHTGFLENALKKAPEETIDEILSRVRVAGENAHEEADLSKAIRLAKGQVALIVAIAETGRVFSPKQGEIALS